MTALVPRAIQEGGKKHHMASLRHGRRGLLLDGSAVVAAGALFWYLRIRPYSDVEGGDTAAAAGAASGPAAGGQGQAAAPEPAAQPASPPKGGPGKQ